MPKLRNGGLSVRERNFVKNLTKGNNQVDSAILAGYSKRSASSIASQLMTKGKIVQALDDEGLSDKFLAKTIKQNIIEGTGIKATADTATKNVELALRLKGYLGKEDTSVTNNTQNNYIIELNNLSDEELEARYNRLQEVTGTSNVVK